jgi:hypothetical protein
MSQELKNYLVDYFANTIPVQWKDKPKAIGILRAIIDCELIDTLPYDILGKFSLDEAEGELLTFIGKLFNIPRFMNVFSLGNKWFVIPNYADAESDDTTGFTSYNGKLNFGSQFRRYVSTDTTNTELLDETLRVLIKLRIALLGIALSVDSIKKVLYTFFGNQIRFQANFDMTVSYFVSDANTQLFSALSVSDMLPRPLGMSITGIEVVTHPFGVVNLLDYDSTVIPNLSVFPYSEEHVGIYFLTYEDDD